MLGDERQDPAHVREDEADVGAARERPAEEEARDRTCRVDRKLEHPVGDAGHQVAAAIGDRRMHVDDRAAAIQLVDDRRERRIAEPAIGIARQKADAVRFQRVERILDLAQAVVDVRQRQAREKPEALAMIRRHARAEVVAFAVDREKTLVRNEREAGRRDGRERGRDARRVHVLDGHLRRPVARDAAGQIVLVLDQLCDERRRKEMVMNVDARMVHRGFIQRIR